MRQMENISGASRNCYFVIACRALIYECASAYHEDLNVRKEFDGKRDAISGMTLEAVVRAIGILPIFKKKIGKKPRN